MELTIEGTSAVVSPLSANIVEVTVNDTDAGSLLGQIDVQEAVNHYGSTTLLDLIGRDEAIAHFEIEEKE